MGKQPKNLKIENEFSHQKVKKFYIKASPCIEEVHGHGVAMSSADIEIGLSKSGFRNIASLWYERICQVDVDVGGPRHHTTLAISSFDKIVFLKNLKKMFFYIFVFFVFTLLLFSYKQILFWKNRPPGFIFTHFTHFWSTLFFTLSKCIVHFNAGRSRDRGMIVCRRTPGWVLIMI